MAPTTAASISDPTQPQAWEDGRESSAHVRRLRVAEREAESSCRACWVSCSISRNLGDDVDVQLGAVEVWLSRPPSPHSQRQVLDCSREVVVAAAVAATMAESVVEAGGAVSVESAEFVEAGEVESAEFVEAGEAMSVESAEFAEAGEVESAEFVEAGEAMSVESAESVEAGKAVSVESAESVEAGEAMSVESAEFVEAGEAVSVEAGGAVSVESAVSVEADVAVSVDSAESAESAESVLTW